MLGETPADKEFYREEIRKNVRDLLRKYPQTVFAIAAGNSGKDLGHDPQFYAWDRIDLPNVVIVGSHDALGNRSTFSNHGKDVRVMATGEEISIHSRSLHRNPLRKIKNDTFQVTGTSFASPRFLNLLIKHHRALNKDCSNRSSPTESLNSLLFEMKTYSTAQPASTFVDETPKPRRRPPGPPHRH